MMMYAFSSLVFSILIGLTESSLQIPQSCSSKTTINDVCSPTLDIKPRFRCLIKNKYVNALATDFLHFVHTYQMFQCVSNGVGILIRAHF